MRLSLFWPRLAKMYSEFEESRGASYFEGKLLPELYERLNRDPEIYQRYRMGMITHHLRYLDDLLEAEAPMLRGDPIFGGVLIAAIHLTAAHIFIEKGYFFQAFNAAFEASKYAGAAELVDVAPIAFADAIREQQREYGKRGRAAASAKHDLPRRTAMYEFIQAHPAATAADIVREVQSGNLCKNDRPGKDTINYWFNVIKDGWDPSQPWPEKKNK